MNSDDGPWDLELLRTLVVLADEGHFTRAGQRLGLSQAAVSQRLAQLEALVGMPLLERLPGGARPTPAGRTLVHEAQGLLAHARQVREAMGAMAGAGRPLHLATTRSPGAFLLPLTLARFALKRPGLRPSAHVVDGTGLGALPLPEVDFVLVEALPGQGLGSAWKPLLRLDDELVLLLPPDHAWAGRKRLAWAQLVGQPLILRPPHAPIRQQVNEGLRQAGVAPEEVPPSFELDDTEGIKRAVVAGLGLGFACRYAVAREVARGELVAVRLGATPMRRQVLLAGRAEGPSHPEGEALAEALGQAHQRLHQRGW